MIKIILSFLSLMSNLIFTQMKHPLAMGLLLMMQTLLICLISGNYANTFWFSYVLFLVFLGGMLVLFVYVTSLASNEMFIFSMKIMSILMAMLGILMMMMLIFDFNLINISFINNNEMNSMNMMNNFMVENSINLNKMYNFPTNMITLLLINYLFLTLIAVVKITNIFYGPLRPKS